MMMQYSLVSVMTVYCSAPVLMLMLLLAGVYLKVGIVIQQHHHQVSIRAGVRTRTRALLVHCAAVQVAPGRNTQTHICVCALGCARARIGYAARAARHHRAVRAHKVYMYSAHARTARGAQRPSCALRMYGNTYMCYPLTLLCRYPAHGPFTCPCAAADATALTQ